MLLSELKLSRVYQAFSQTNHPAGLITAFRHEFKHADNVKRNYELARTVHEAGFGFVWVDGAWVENEGTPDEQHVSEVSLLIHAHDGEGPKLFELMKAMCAKYNQDGFVFKDGKETGVFDRTGKEQVSFNQVKYNQLSKMYTKLRTGDQRSFVFEKTRLPFTLISQYIMLPTPTA
jgi:hypothetical protein